VDGVAAGFDGCLDEELNVEERVCFAVFEGADTDGLVSVRDMA